MQLRQTRDILQQTNAEVVAGVRSALRRARQVCCYGSGREGLALKAFAIRLHQMDISVSPLPPSTPWLPYPKNFALGSRALHGIGT